MRINRATRRAFLGGGAVAVGLPFLESLLPRAVRAQSASAPTRLIYYWIPNGLDMATFRPASTGPDYVIPPMLEPLADLKSDFTVVTGLNNENANPDGPGDHAAGTASFITCAHAFKSETEIELGISADQIAAEQIGSETRVPSLQLGIDGGSAAGDCDSGYSCAYARSISWTGPSTPLPKIVDPGQVFDELFSGFDPTASEAELEKRRFYNLSVLDSVVGDATSLQTKLGYTDTLKLQEYLDGVRELERRVTDQSVLACEPGARPDSDYDYPDKVKVMHDLMVLALSCDATRVISFMLGNAVSGRTHPFLGITRGHHDISHHNDDPQNLADLRAIGVWQMEQLRYLFSQLKAVAEGPDPANNLLYNTTIFISSDISDGDRHNHNDMPILLAGHGGGHLSPGRHISYPREQEERVANLLTVTLQTVGVESALGDSTTPLVDL